MSADIGNIKVGQAPQGIKPPVLNAPAAPGLPVAPSAPIAISAPTTSGTGTSKKLVYVVAGVLILGAIIYALVSLMGGPGTSPVASDSPSPSTTPTATLTGKSLKTYFGNPSSTITLQSAATAPDDFRNGLISVQPSAKTALPLSITLSGSAPSPAVLLSALTPPVPVALESVFGTDWTVMAFGQTEHFDASGAKVESAVSTKVILVIEVTDVSAANQAMRAWESAGLASASNALLGFDSSRNIVAGFGEGAYRTIPVRYWNFPYADNSIDYAILSAPNNKSYLILAASRESMFYTIDQLMQ